MPHVNKKSIHLIYKTIGYPIRKGKGWELDKQEVTMEKLKFRKQEVGLQEKARWWATGKHGRWTIGWNQRFKQS